MEGRNSPSRNPKGLSIEVDASVAAESTARIAALRKHSTPPSKRILAPLKKSFSPSALKPVKLPLGGAGGALPSSFGPGSTLKRLERKSEKGAVNEDSKKQRSSSSSSKVTPQSAPNGKPVQSSFFRIAAKKAAARVRMTDNFRNAQKNKQQQQQQQQQKEGVKAGEQPALGSGVQQSGGGRATEQVEMQQLGKTTTTTTTTTTTSTTTTMAAARKKSQDVPPSVAAATDREKASSQRRRSGTSGATKNRTSTPPQRQIDELERKRKRMMKNAFGHGQQQDGEDDGDVVSDAEHVEGEGAHNRRRNRRQRRHRGGAAAAAWRQPKRYYTRTPIEALRLRVVLENAPPPQGAQQNLKDSKISERRSALRRLSARAGEGKKGGAEDDAKRIRGRDEKGGGRTRDNTNGEVGGERKEIEERDANGGSIGAAAAPKQKESLRGSASRKEGKDAGATTSEPERIKRVERVFSWQQKIFSPQEIRRYSTAGETKRDLELRYAGEVNSLLRTRYPEMTCAKAARRAIARAGGAMLFTKIDADDYVDYIDYDRRASTSRSVPPRSRSRYIIRQRQRQRLKELVASAWERSHLGGGGAGGAQGRREQQHQSLSLGGHDDFHQVWDYGYPQRMFIMAALDIPELEKSRKMSEHYLERTEMVLMELRYYEKGMLILKPDVCVAPDQWYPLRSHLGETWRMRITVEPPDKHDTLPGREEETTMVQARHQNRITTSLSDPWEAPPPENHTRLFILAQLKKAIGFDASRLRCSVRLVLPNSEDWATAPGLPETYMRDGGVITTHTSLAKVMEDVRVHHIGQAIELDLLTKMRKADEGGELLGPRRAAVLEMEFFSIDYFGCQRVEGYLTWQLPRTPGHGKAILRVWRPTGTPEAKLQQYYLGARVGIDKSLSNLEHSRVKHNDLSGFTTESAGSVEIEYNVAVTQVQQQQQQPSQSATMRQESGMRTPLSTTSSASSFRFSDFRNSLKAKAGRKNSSTRGI